MPPAKGLSLQTNFRDFPPFHPNDYRYWGNRDTIRGTFRCRWVKFFISWAEVQPYQPASTNLEGMWSNLNSQGIWDRADAIIRQCNDDGVQVLLSIFNTYPSWVNGATAADPETGKAASQKFPIDLQPSGYWDHFVSYLYNRYRFVRDGTGTHGISNASGPNSSNWNGNPRSAWISGLEIVNEPNTSHWPLQDVHCKVAQMMKTAENAVAFWNGTTGQPACGILAPAANDIVGDRFTANGVLKGRDYAGFENDVLQVLLDWRPRVYFGWSMHNYGDVEYAATNGGAPYPHSASTVDRLYNKNWRGGGDRQVWISEGGYRMPPGPTGWNATAAHQDAQARGISNAWRDMSLRAEIVMWLNHQLLSPQSDTSRSALRRFDETSSTAYPYGHETDPYTSWAVFRDLPQ